MGVRVLTAFSFYATKNLTTAEGGMLTGDHDTIEQARIWSLHGMSRDAYKRYSAEGSWYYEVILPGFKCNMTDIQAAIGLHQLRKLPQFQARRQEIVRRYNEAFSQFEELQTPVERPEVESAWHLYAPRLNLDRLTIDRAHFIQELKARNIGTSVHFIPIHLHPYYRDKYGYKPQDFPVAYENYLRLVSLPLNLRVSDQDVEDVIEAVTDVVATYRR
jgi:dTDP-4-amino-4,6-dideoxygalactose transaminase